MLKKSRKKWVELARSVRFPFGQILCKCYTLNSYKIYGDRLLANSGGLGAKDFGLVSGLRTTARN
jgi:hypothetical protein